MPSSQTLDVSEVVRGLIDDASERLGADALAVWLRGGDGSELILARAVGFRHRVTLTDLAHRPSGRVRDWLAPRRLPAAVTLRATDAIGERAWLAAERFHSLLAVPLPGGDTPLGVLAAFRRRRPFPVGSLGRAATLATTTAALVDAARQLEAQRTRAERAETLLDVANILEASTNLDVALDEIGRRTARAIGASRWDLSLSTSLAASDAGAPAANELVIPMNGKAGAIGTLTLGAQRVGGWSTAAVDLAVDVAALVTRALEQQDLIQCEALRALGELASGAAHHLNNLLTVVVGRVQLVQRSTDDERVQRTLAIVEKAAKDGADIVYQLQQFSRGRGVREARPVCVDPLIAEVVAAAQGSWPRTPLTKVDVDTRLGGVPDVAGDAAALREALRHILANAVEAMPTGGRLLIETRASDTSVSIVISDTGVGMSPAVRLRASEPFFTTKGLKVTGLGLSVAYGIVRSHGGDIAIRSAQGSGTTVIVTLPREGASSAGRS